MTVAAREINFDGLVGPTHNYAGLSFGNVASMDNSATVSNPRAAALQGLHKMKTLADLGVLQAVLPPQERPALSALRQCGFQGSDTEILAQTWRTDPGLLAACCSASNMWAANAATVSPSADTGDERVHFTPANLVQNLHRSIESAVTRRVLQKIFPSDHFTHHPPLPASMTLSDEGAANHTRLCRSFGEPGIELFCYGAVSDTARDQRPKNFPVRQTREASTAITRLHTLDSQRTMVVRQNADAIDAGVFHSDVILVGNVNVLLFHSMAFAETTQVLDELRKKFEQQCEAELHLIAISPAEVSLRDAVDSYLFNSQLVSLPDQSMLLLAPVECAEIPATRAMLDRIREAPNPIRDVRTIDLRQSMRNGGGPACLRLRVVLTEAERRRMHQPVMLTEQVYTDLAAWIQQYYRESLTLHDLADPALLNESREALDALTRILQLGAIYDFQQS